MSNKLHLTTYNYTALQSTAFEAVFGFEVVDLVPLKQLLQNRNTVKVREFKVMN